MPKLLQINSVVNRGSTGRIVEQIGTYAIQKGWESYIAYGRSSGTSRSKLIRVGSKCDKIIHGIHTRLFDRHGLASTESTKLLIKEVQIINPDVIHLHNIHGYYLNFRVLFNFLSSWGTPLVWTLHDCWAFTGHCTHFSDIKCMKWQDYCHECPKIRNYPSSLLIDNSSNNFKLKKRLFNSIPKINIVAVSDWLASNVKNSFLNEKDVRVIHNGIDLDEFFPIKDTTAIDHNYCLKDRRVLLALATSWTENKGLSDYLKLSAILPPEFVIVLVGISKPLSQSFSSNVIGIERIESVNELAALYSRADILLNLSYQESFGMTTIEGLACGTPAIVYNNTASPELLTKDTGLVVETGDILGVYSAVKEITNHRKESFSINCRQLAIDRYNKNDRCQDYLNLYQCLMDKTMVKYP